ncbi:MAG: hypothetical protein ACYTBV_19895, partial [Planctomycetota bacterium]
MKGLHIKPQFGSCLLFIMIYLFLLLSACGGDGSSSDDSSSNTGSVIFSVAWPGEANTIASTDDDYYITAAPAGVVTVRVIVSGPGMTDMQQNFIASVGSGTVTGVPAGPDRTVTLQGLDSIGTITHEGSVSNITVIAGQTANAGTVVMILRGFVKTVAPVTGDAFNAPFDDVSNDHEQNLFFASDINGSGYIKSLSFSYMNNESMSTNCPDVTIKMGHTSLSALTTTFANNVEQGRGSLATVFTGAVTIPTGSAGDYFTISLDTPFHYNGVDNLVVEFIKSILCDNSVELATTTAVYTDVTLWDSNEASATGSLWDNYPNVKFTFAGGDNYLDFSNGTLATGNSFPFNTNASTGRKVQLLYPASDIDGSGPITGIGFPVGATTTNQTYTVTIKLG